MRKFYCLFAVVVFSVACAHMFHSQKLDKKARSHISLRLGEMAEQDQAARNCLQEKNINTQEAFIRINSVDSKNLPEIKSLINTYGWIKTSEFGDTASHNASLLIQHADSDTQFQEYCLGLMENSLRTNDADPSDFAYLWDRVKSKKNEPQRFGTQGICKGKNQWEPTPIENPGKIEERRKALGMVTFTEYLKQVSESCR